MKFNFTLFLILFYTFCKAQVVAMPDSNFKAKLLAASSENETAKDLAGNYFKIDSNNDGEIQISEALQVSYLDIFWSQVDSIDGISAFKNLKFFCCAWNNLPTLNLTGLINLETLWAWKCYTTTYNLTGCTNLNYIDCSQNSMGYLDVHNLTNLASIKCDEHYTSNVLSLNLDGCINLKSLEINDCNILNDNLNQNLAGLNNLETLICISDGLTSLEVGHLTHLTKLDCRGNQIAALDVTNLTNLQELIFYNNNVSVLNTTNLSNLTKFWGDNNQIATLDFSNCSLLTTLYCGNNQLTFLDVTSCTNLINFSCHENLLTTLFMKNGIDEYTNDFSGNPNLNYICCDEFERSQIQSIANNIGLVGCDINTYCSFVPGGTYYVIDGNSKFDGNANGCESSDSDFPHLKLRLIGSGVDTYYIPGNSGNYNIPIQEGTYSLFPILENLNYYNLTPSSINVNFPAQSSPVSQNFCITPNGVHNDLEILLLPITNARPGFDVLYKIRYKNKGTTAQSGTINLVYTDAVLDFLAANPAIGSQSTNSLSWTFTNLQPFESREIEVTLNLNGPMETPAVNDGDQLHSSVSIAGLIDETNDDNTATLNQIIQNSFDPNDKTCLEGTAVTSPGMYGKYVHYMIRFENTGTANAQNIVIKDVIDTTKFDVSSLIPIDGSHHFETRVSNNNRVDFIFQNINLPYEDATNDGYIVFKIKIKGHLVVGNTFSNAASIYFDYNYPIVTPTAMTTIANSLQIKQFAANNPIIFPNPVKDILQFKTETIIKKIEIYDMGGRILSTTAVNENKVSLSELKTGDYIVKIYTDEGITNVKIIKE